MKIKKKLLVLLSILTILTSLSSIAMAGEIPPAPIRESIVFTEDIIEPEPISEPIIVIQGEIPPAPIRE